MSNENGDNGNEAMTPEVMPLPSCVTGLAFKGRKWRVLMNGKRQINGEAYGVVLMGEIQEVQEGATIYDLITHISECVKEKNAEMTYPDSFVMTLSSPDEQCSAPVLAGG
jgi:hypothetical protein